MIALRGYQRDAVSFLRSHPRALLADEPGLGKTFPAIHAAADGPLGGAALVVVPPYLMLQWRQAIADYLGPVPVLLLHRKSPPIPDDWRGFVVTGYHTLMRAGVQKHPELLSRRWPVVIADEAHRLRGRKNQWTQTFFKLKADRLWMLTGTPIVNNPGDLWPLLRLCDPKAFSSYWRFVGEWCVCTKTPWATEIGGLKPGLEHRFHELLDPFYLRRSLEEHLPELPPVIPHVVPVALSGPAQKAHDRAKASWLVEFPDLDTTQAVTGAGALIPKLRQIAAGYVVDQETGEVSYFKENAKLEAVQGILEDHPDEPIVVFCWFRETAALLAAHLTDVGRTVWVLTGDLSPTTRARWVEDWKTCPAGIIVATIAALQEGANLQHARTVVFAEHDYLPASIEQATARVHRFGQDYPVNVYHVLAEQSIDQSLWKVLRAREGNIVRALLEDLYAGGRQLARVGATA